MRDEAFLHRLVFAAGDDFPFEPSRARWQTARVTLLEIHRDAFAGADAPSELFWQAAAKQFARAAEWLDKQPPAVFAEAAGLGLKMDVFIGSWIESDQFDLHLPAAFLRACGKHGLDISVCTND